MKRNRHVAESLCATVMILLIGTGWAHAQDKHSVPASPAGSLLTGSDTIDPCIFGALSSPLPLFEAVSRALCYNPKTRSAWAAIKLGAASVRMAKENFLPTLQGSAEYLHGSTDTRLSRDPLLDTAANDFYPEGTLSLSWVLFDFGERSAELKSAQELLAAARANLDVNLQQVFLQTAADYYDAQAAEASVAAAREVETLTQRSAGAAHVRMQRGVAPVSDELQAQTAYAQAVVNRIRSDEQLNAKSGALAVDMGVDPDARVVLPPASPNINAAGDFAAGLHELIEAAKRNHPSVVEAERELAAAEADVRAARDHGFPKISLMGQLNRSDEPLTPNLGSPTVPGSVSSKSIGIEIDIPLSDPLWKRGVIAKARAQVAVQEEALYGAEQQVALDVWTSYTALQAATENVKSLQTLVQTAQESLDATERRYEGGAGSILELLSAQAAYASAKEQQIRALSDWRIARLALSASLGQLRPASVGEGR
jgi:outer membrane protein